MITYRKSDGTQDVINEDNVFSINIRENKFIITLKYYGYDEYDFWYEEITDIVEIRI